MVAALALEIEHGIDHVLQHARARYGAVLGDMADQQQRRVSPPGDLDQRLGGGAHLRDRAGRRLKAVEMHGLDRIHHRHFAPLGEGGRDVARRRGGRERNGRIRHAEAARPHGDLRDGLLAGDIEAVVAPGRQLRSGLQQ